MADHRRRLLFLWLEKQSRPRTTAEVAQALHAGAGARSFALTDLLVLAGEGVVRIVRSRPVAWEVV
jgi:hypothetical protein